MKKIFGRIFHALKLVFSIALLSVGLVMTALSAFQMVYAGVQWIRNEYIDRAVVVPDTTYSIIATFGLVLGIFIAGLGQYLLTGLHSKDNLD